MRQAVMTDPGKITIGTADVPKIGPQDVLVKVGRIGICGSDLHVYHGMHPYTSYPVVQGHEVGGTVAELGSEVSGLKVGDVVTFMPQVTCGSCYQCTHGQEHLCQDLKVMGFQAPGAGQDYFSVPSAAIVRLPDGSTTEQAAFIEPVSVAVHAVRRAGAVSGKQVLVLGGGTIGNLTAQVAKALGAKKVMLTDLSDFKLQLARNCRIDFTVNPKATNLAEYVATNFGADGVDVTFECVGAEATIGQAIELARKGSTIVVVGVFSEKPSVDFGLIQDHELNVFGTLMYQRPDFELAVDLLSNGQVNTAALVTGHFPFERYLAAYEEIEADPDRSIKVMIDVDP